jgi:ribosome-associated protein
MNDNLFDDLPREEEEDDGYVSRSQRKREVEALQDLGKKLIDLKPDQLNKMPIDETLLAAITEAKRLTSRNALKRQMQYIGKLMRHEDGDAIQNMLDRFDTTSDVHNQVFHKLEKWRDRLLADEPGMFDLLMNEYPEVDIQHLRQLIRNAQRETQQNKPPASARKLFKYLRSLEESKL